MAMNMRNRLISFFSVLLLAVTYSMFVFADDVPSHARAAAPAYESSARTVVVLLDDVESSSSSDPVLVDTASPLLVQVSSEGGIGSLVIEGSLDGEHWSRLAFIGPEDQQVTLHPTPQEQPDFDQFLRFPNPPPQIRVTLVHRSGVVRVAALSTD